MDKFRIFLSHIHEEGAVALALKDALERLLSGAVEVFVSSDRGSIPGGVQWLNKISEALKSSDLLLVLVSPTSVNRPWVNFEAGGGFFAHKRVIPLLFGGLTFRTLIEPLHSLQGIDLTDPASLATLLKDVTRLADLRMPYPQCIEEAQSTISSVLAGFQDSANGSSQPRQASDSTPNGSRLVATDTSCNAAAPTIESSQHYAEADIGLLDSAFPDLAAIFSDRLAEAFPGTEGLTWFDDPSVCVQRLTRLLKAPLVYSSPQGSPNSTSCWCPIWWFRGTSNMYIRSCRSLSPTKILVNDKELEIAKIAVYRPPAYHWELVYVESKAESVTGLQRFSKEDIKRMVNEFGYAYESYGLYGGRLITYGEYQDRWAIIDGEHVRVTGAELRVRYLTPYNLLICSQASPINQLKFDRQLEKFLGGILAGTHSLEQLAELIWLLPRKDIRE